MTDISKNILGISPPWYTFANKLKNTYGVSNLVQVNDLIEAQSGNYYLIINAFEDDVAYALRQILPLNIIMGNITVNLVIFNTKGAIVKLARRKYNVEEIDNLFNTALKGNPLFIKTVTANKRIFVVIAKEIVQFFNNDISDLCSNLNEVAAKVFDEITTTEFESIKVGFSTYDPNCRLIKGEDLAEQ